MNQPYIGITDFTSAQQAEAMRRVLDEKGSTHLLHVGVMMSYKTLRGLPTRWAEVYPPKEALADIFVKRPGVLNVLHYADYDAFTGIEDWVEALHWAGPGVDALQLDMPWPDPGTLGELRLARTAGECDIKFILQVSRRALEIVGRIPGLVLERLEEYRMMSCLDYVLFDLSGGKGVPMDAEKLLPFVEPVLEHLPDVRVAVAGGLGPCTMGLARPILKRFARDRIPISFDAQSMLRLSGSAEDPVDWNLADTYLRGAATLAHRCAEGKPF